MKIEDIAERSAYYFSVTVGIPYFLMLEYFSGRMDSSFREKFCGYKRRIDMNREIHEILNEVFGDFETFKN